MPMKFSQTKKSVRSMISRERKEWRERKQVRTQVEVVSKEEASTSTLMISLEVVVDHLVRNVVVEVAVSSSSTSTWEVVAVVPLASNTNNSNNNNQWKIYLRTQKWLSWICRLFSSFIGEKKYGFFCSISQQKQRVRSLRMSIDSWLRKCMESWR